jgi:two-component system chemotaxis sensor kinase CheA
MSDEYQFDEAELVELRGMFFEQATEVVDSLGELILTIERDPADGETLRTIRRAVHTLKGDSSAFGFGELMALTHRYEDALDQVRNGSGVASRALIDLLLSGADALAALIQHYRGNGPMPDTESLIVALSELQLDNHDGAEVPTSASETTSAALDELVQNPAVEGMSPAVVEHVETIEETVNKPAASENPIDEERRTGQDRRVGKDRRGAESGSTTMRVESERIDAAMNLVGELIIQRSMLASLTSELEASVPGNDTARRLSEAAASSGRILSELQESVMRMRLVAIDQVFRRFPRVVRDASIKTGKPLRMEIAGGQTEIDKSVVELISDPLIHLVRNACDHGIEMQDEREAAGKPAEGVIKLTARRAGNQIAVEVEDDGGGIDPEKIIRKGIQKGLVTAEEVKDWTDQQKLSLIFASGFSTKEQVSDMSGRGVGMDVVKTSVDALGGSVFVSSVVGRGTKVTIKLPLTMAIVRAMLFESCERKFALPLDSIREITRLRAREAKTIDGHEVLRLRDRVMPLIRIDEALGLRTVKERNPEASLFVFVIDVGDGREVGIAVERLYGEQELVLKTIDDALTQSNLVAGASILGDGGVVLILDANAIVVEVGKQKSQPTKLSSSLEAIPA